ncbi:lytic polysaccharide monooxygenase [Xylariomycetidae sp. FL2044]|nr:lytic polysaccharide monooxygenase [Xylariomycetidae sp. FL2044]
MPSLATTLLAVAASASTVLGHGHVRRVIVNGETYPGFELWSEDQDLSKVVTWQFSTEDEGPVKLDQINTDQIICHQDAKNAQASIPVNAGDTLQLVRFNDIGGFEHPGPEMHYLAPCGSSGCAKVDKTSLDFFKFYEKGLVQGGMADSPQWETQKWATTEVHKSVQKEGEGWIDTFSVTIPETIKPGEYVLRHELMGLHRAHIGDAEFYPQCINLKVSGSGTKSPQGESAMDFYDSKDPGINLDIWVNLQSYDIPGPDVAAL